MMRRLALGLLPLLVACAQEGAIDMRFRVADDVSLEGAWLHVSVREADGPVLGADVSRIDDGRIDLSIRHGEDRVATVEVRDGPDPATAAIRGYGISAPFTLEPGQAEAVEVPIDIGAVARVNRLAAPEARGGLVRTPTVQLELTISRNDIARVTLAQDPGLTLGRVEAEVDGGTFTVEYDLDAACRALDACADGPRSVFARVTDEAGYPSEVVDLALQLDTTPPAVVPGTASVQFEAPGRFVEVNQADEGFEVRLSFVVSEALTATPTLALTDSGLPFRFEARANSAWVFVRTIGPDDPDGLQQPVLTAEDRAGNRAELALTATYRVDRDPPGAPDVETPGRIVYRRAPFGTPERPAAHFEVVGADGAVSPFAFVQAYDQATVFDGTRVVAVRLGEGQADAQGAFRLDLAPFDRARVYVLAISASGSVSGPTASLVQHAQYVTPGHAAQPGASPAEAVVRPSLGAGPAPISGEATADRAALLDEGGGTVEVQAPLRYTRYSPTASPAPDARRFAGVTYDPLREELLVVGGRSVRDLVQRDVWAWDGRAWRQSTADGFPACEDGTGFGDDPFGYLAYAGSLSRTVLLCRFLDPVAPPPLSSGETDELRAYGWDGAAWGPIALHGAAPVGRVGHAVAYDPARRQLVMFGGNTGSLQVAGPDAPGFRETLGDLWALEAVLPTALAGTDTPNAQASLRWVQLSPEGPTPGPRDRAALVWDPAREVLVLFGGFGPNRAPLDDLWTWDGTSWTEIPRAGSWPAARGGHTMVFDPRTGRVGLLGGTDIEPTARQLVRQDAGRADGFWWDGTAWNAMDVGSAAGIGVVAGSLPDAPPVQLTAPPFTLEEVRPADTYGLLAKGRLLRTPSADTPPVSIFTDSALDAPREEIVLVGVETGETWRWSTSGWRQRDAGPGPEGDADAVVHDPILDRTYAWARTFALNPSRLFVLDPVGSWALVEPAVRPRSADLTEPLLSFFDADRQQMVTYLAPSSGGWSLWGFDGAAWTRLEEGAATHGLSEAARIGDLGGGDFLVSDNARAFAYVGQSFSPAPPAPPGHLAFDAGRGRLMSFEDEGEVYERALDGTWARVATENALPVTGIDPGPTQHHFDAAGRRFWTTLGSAPGQAPGAVFALDVDPATRPALLTRLDLEAARVPAGLVTALSVEAVAGGAAYEVATARAGVEVVGYDPGLGRWRSLDASSATAESPAALVARAEGELASQLVLTRPARAILAVTTAGARGQPTPGAPPPRLVVDRLFLRVDYRLTETE